MSKKIPSQLVDAFVFGGHAKFALVNPISESRIVFQVSHRDGEQGRPGVFFVNDITHNTNERGRYIGYIAENDRGCLRAGRKGNVTDPSFVAFSWFLRNPGSNQVEVHHIDRCARCGLRLEDEVSVALGFGPTCCKHLGIEHVMPETDSDAHLNWTEIDDAKAIVRALNPEATVFPFRTMGQVKAFLARALDGGLTVGEAVEMYQANPEEGRGLVGSVVSTPRKFQRLVEDYVDHVHNVAVKHHGGF